MASEAAEPLKPSGRETVMDRIAGAIGTLSNGDHAQLRRMFLPGKQGQADGVVIGLLHRAGVDLERVERTPGAFERWRLVVHVAALLSGTTRRKLHARDDRLGAALSAAGYSEARLLRLTSTRGPALRDLLVRAARVLAQAGKSDIDLWAIYHLAAGDSERAEAARLRLAQSYYTAEARPAGDSK